MIAVIMILFFLTVILRFVHDLVEIVRRLEQFFLELHEPAFRVCGVETVQFHGLFVQQFLEADLV